MSIIVLENNLLQIIQGSAINQRVREVEILPDVKEKSLINLFQTKAPAIYISYSRAPTINDYADRRFSVVCLARISRSHQHQRPGIAAQHGDGKTIGVFQMTDYIEALLDGNQGWSVRSDTELQIDLLRKAGLVGMAIELSIRDSLDQGVDDADLNPFTTYTADHSLAAGTDEPASIDHVTLEQ